MAAISQRAWTRIGWGFAVLAWSVLLIGGGYAWLVLPEPSSAEPGLGARYYTLMQATMYSLWLGSVAFVLGIEGLMHRQHPASSRLLTIISSPFLLAAVVLAVWKIGSS